MHVILLLSSAKEPSSRSASVTEQRNAGTSMELLQRSGFPGSSSLPPSPPLPSRTMHAPATLPSTP